MTIYLVVPLLLGVAIVQTGLLPHVLIWGVFPDLPVLVVSSWSLLRGRREGLIWGFVAGMAVDLLSGAPFGAATLALMATGLVAGLGRAAVFRAHVALPLVAAFVATFVYDLVFMAVTQITGQEVAWLDTLARTVLRSAIVNALLALPTFWVLRLLSRWSEARAMQW